MSGLGRLSAALSIHALYEHCSLTYVSFTMQFRIPGREVSVRLFERVETVDNQYDIFDIGLQQADGSIDSVVVGGSFSYAKSLCKKADEKAAENKAKADEKVTPIAVVA